MIETLLVAVVLLVIHSLMQDRQIKKLTKDRLKDKGFTELLNDQIGHVHKQHDDIIKALELQDTVNTEHFKQQKIQDAAIDKIESVVKTQGVDIKRLYANAKYIPS